MTPITIGDQKFIKDIDKGWIDSKTKQPADKGLIRLLDSLVVNEPALKRLRSKIDRTVEPISFGGQKFVYDVNQGWIDEKTKIPVPPALQSTLNSVVSKPTVPDISESMGMIASAGLQQTKTTTPRKKTGSGTLVYTNINKPIVKMIGTLASMDALLKQRLNNQKIIAENDLLATRESQIEANSQIPQLQTAEPDAKKVDGSAAGVLAIGGLLLLTLDPVQEAIKSIVSGVVETGKFITGTVSSINKAFSFLFGATNTDITAPESQGNVKQSKTTQTVSPDNSKPVTTPSDAQPVTSEAKPTATTPAASRPTADGIMGSFIPKADTNTSGSSSATSSRSSSAAPKAAASPSTTSDATSVSSSTASNTDAVGGSVTPVSPGAAGAADAAETQVGMKGSQVGGYLNQGGVALNPSQDQWCSAFVNSSLARTGIKGANNVANSFQRWGVQIDPNQVKKGDVVLQTRGKGPDQPGGHVGIATGRIVDGKVEMIAGNSGKGSGPASRTVKKYFVPINQKLQVRRNDPNAPGITAAATGTAGNSLMQAAADTVNAGAGKIGELFGMLGSAIIKPGVPRDKEDYSKAITAAAVQTNTETAVAKTPKPVLNLSAPKPANINKSGSGATQNAATSTDKDSVYYYLRRFGFQELSAPVKPAAMA